MSNLVVEFCTNCKKSTCKYGDCAELKNYVKSLRKKKLLKNKGGETKQCLINIG